MSINVFFMFTYVICSLNSSPLLFDDEPTSEEEDIEAEPELIENECFLTLIRTKPGMGWWPQIGRS